MEEEQQEGVSLLEILSVIWKRIIWILAASVVAALVCGLVVKFAVSPSRESYQISFVLDFPNQTEKNGENETGKLYYPDGTVFRYETIVYAENLSAAKESAEEFQNIDVEKMSSSAGISISMETVNDSDAVYTISAAGKYFSDSTQATKFLKAVCEQTRKKIVDKSAVLSYTSELNNYTAVATDEQRLEILENQHSSILEQYETYLPLYKNFSYQGKTLATYYAEATAFFQRSDLVQIQIKKKQLEQEYHSEAYKALNEAMRELIEAGDLASYEGMNSFFTAMASHQEQYAQLELEITRLRETLSSEEQTATYEEELKKLYSLINAEAETCKAAITALYDENTVFNYQQSGVISVGGMSTLKYAAVAFVIVFVIACIVCCAVDFTRKKKAGAHAKPQTSPETESEAPSDAAEEKSPEVKPAKKGKE